MRLLRAPFVLFNNLPLAVKLGLTTFGAMLLLGALAWIASAALDTQRTLDARLASAATAERAGRRALIAVRDMRIAAREMHFARAADAMTEAAERAETMGGRVKRELDEMVDGLDDDAKRDMVGRAAAALTDYQDKLTQEAALRQAAIAALADFAPKRAATVAAAGELRDILAREWLLPELATQAQGDIGAVLEATAALQAAVLADAGDAPSAGGDGAGPLAAPRAQLEEHGAALASLPVTPAASAAAAKLVAAAAALATAAQTALDTSAAAARFATDESEAANRRLAGRVDGAISPFVDAAEEAHDSSAAELERAQFTLRALSGGAMLALVILGGVFIRSITRPIRAMTRLMQRIAAGDTSQRIGFAGRRDEVGRMAAALEILRESVGRAFVQGEMIGQLPMGVMTAEPGGDHRITYANPAVADMLAPIARLLPAPPDRLVGQSLAILFPDPAQVRAMVDDPARLPQRSVVHLGEEALEATISPLRQADGTYSGPMLSWRVLTGQERLSAKFEQSVVGIALAVGHSAEAMAGTADAMSRQAAGSGQQLDLVNAASRNASGNVQAVAASAEELSASVNEIARQVAESARIASEAVAEAEATDTSVAGLAEAATRIGDVVRLIRDIAGRTNLLALNATIEAARAGEAGRGFAVVAGEVKTLANQTARATEEIATQIASIQAETGLAVAALRSIGGTIRRMNEIATAIAGAVEQQGAATQEIARSVQAAAAGTAEVDSTIAHVADTAQRTGAQAADVVAAAQALSGQSATLQQEIADFLAALKAA